MPRYLGRPSPVMHRLGPRHRRFRKGSGTADLFAVQTERARARVPVTRDLDRREPLLARSEAEVFGGVWTAGRNLSQRLQRVLGGPDLVEQIQQGTSHRRGEKCLERREVSGMARVQGPEVARPIRRQDVDGRPVVFQKMKIQEEATDAAVPITERVNRLEIEVHPRSEWENPGAIHVLLRVALLPLGHEGADPLHARWNVPDTCNPNVHPPPLTRVRLDTSEHGLVEVQ